MSLAPLGERMGSRAIAPLKPCRRLAADLVQVERAPVLLALQVVCGDQGLTPHRANAVDANVPHGAVVADDDVLADGVHEQAP
jgi:hypothetical protein